MTQKIYTLKNDFMFKTVMSDEENLKPFLQRLFPEKTFKKLIIEQEKSLKASVNSHGVRLDITATDEEGVYNVEMNSLYTVTSLRRGRYYASSLDISLLKPDTKYEELPNVTVVFVISNDLFCDNICLHTGEMRWDPPGRMAETYGVKQVYINLSAEIMNVPEDLIPVLEYFRDNVVNDDSYVQKLSVAAKNANDDPVWRRAVMDLEERMRMERQTGIQQGIEQGIEQGIQQGIQQGIEQGSRESMIRLYLQEKLSLADCAQECGMSEEEFLAAAEEYRRKLKEE